MNINKPIPQGINKQKKILILILDSGENELQTSLRSLDQQTYKNWDRVIFSNLPNKTAHDTLYSSIMANSNKYNLFIKLDADMVLINKHTLKNIVYFFNSNPNVDQANFSVYDIMSDWDIMGLLVFTNNARWSITNEKLFVDHAPTIHGKRFLVWGSPSPVALHCSNPHNFQAFHYGAHRALKAIQKNRTNKKWIQSAIQWHLLTLVWKKYRKLKDRQRGLMMAGAYSVWSKKVDLEGNEYGNKSLKKAYNNYSQLTDHQIYSLINVTWKNKLLINNLLYILLYPKIIEYKIRCRISVFFNKF